MTEILRPDGTVLINLLRAVAKAAKHYDGVLEGYPDPSDDRSIFDRQAAAKKALRDALEALRTEDGPMILCNECGFAATRRGTGGTFCDDHAPAETPLIGEAHLRWTVLTDDRATWPADFQKVFFTTADRGVIPGCFYKVDGESIWMDGTDPSGEIPRPLAWMPFPEPFEAK